MQVTISLDDLASLKRDLEYYKNLSKEYHRIRNRLADEVNQLSGYEKYMMFDFED